MDGLGLGAVSRRRGGEGHTSAIIGGDCVVVDLWEGISEG